MLFAPIALFGALANFRLPAAATLCAIKGETVWKSLFEFAPESTPAEVTEERSYRPLVVPGRGAVALIALVVVVDIVIVFDLGQVSSTLTNYLAGNATVDDVIAALNNATGMLVLEQLIRLLAGIVFLVWLWRARRNAELLAGPQSQRLARGWTIGGWFLPLANLLLPYRIVSDIYRASSDRPRHAYVVGAWWVLLVLNEFAGIAARFIRTGNPATQVHTIFVLLSVVIGLTVVAAALVGVIVFRVTRWQNAGERLTPVEQHLG